MWQNYEKVIDPLPRSGELKKQQQIEQFWSFWWNTNGQRMQLWKTRQKKKPADEPTLPQHNRSQMQLDTNAPNKVAWATVTTVVFLNSGIWCHAEEGALAAPL